MTSGRQTVILHIGAHKTGTSAIQRFCWENREALAHRGFLYPTSCNHLAAQHRLAFALKDARRHPASGPLDYRQELGSLKQEIAASGCPTVLVSSEELFSIKPDKIALLSEELHAYEVKILAVLRRPDQLFESIYNQRVKGTGNQFTRHYRDFLAIPHELSANLRFDRVLDSWARGFGKQALILRCYEQEADSMVLFAKAVELPLDGLHAAPQRRNESVSVRAAEMIRQGKLLGLDEAALRMLAHIGQSAFPKPTETGALLSPAERLDLLKKFDAATDAVFSGYFKGPNIYHSSRFSPADFPEKSELTIANTVRIISDLMKS